MTTRELLDELAAERILILDGAMGSLIQSYGLGEEDFRGERFAYHDQNLAGCNDLLCLTRPALIRSIHEAYLAAGAGITKTCSFNATAVSLADFGLADLAYEISREAAAIARATADEFSARGGRRFVAGSIGPTARSAAIAPDMEDPAARAITFGELEAAYYDNARGLLDGGADILLVETVYDTLNAKAALFAISRLLDERGLDTPVMVSATIAGPSGRLLAGQTIEAFCASVLHARPWALGLNCSLGAANMRPYLESLSRFAPTLVSCHPNAGMPNALGGYDETPRSMAAVMGEFMAGGLLNIAGGCCGTTPEHIAALAAAAPAHRPRKVPPPPRGSLFAGLDALTIDPEKGGPPVLIGERCNVAGSRRFLGLIKGEKWDEAVNVASEMAGAGAEIIDVCMDDPLLDSTEAMVKFLNCALSDPDVARRPVMLDSSRWETLEAGLRCLQGKGLVNSISLKEGEAEFLRRSRLIRRYGAAAVVMLFDETGQAVTFERKNEVAQRSYELLTADGFPPEDIVFDPNVLAIATGLPEHEACARDFIRAAAWIRRQYPAVQISGGVSNLSFSFRGNDPVRRALHAAFIDEAGKAGLSLAIVNPAETALYAGIDGELREAAREAVLCGGEESVHGLHGFTRIEERGSRKESEGSKEQKNRSTASDALLALALKYKDNGEKKLPVNDKVWRGWDAERRVVYGLVNGIDEYIEGDILELRPRYADAIGLVEGPLLGGMEEVGRLFGEGRLFLPQVIRSARVMKKAVAALEPFLAAEKTGGGDTVVLATVKGDVHDIGKNIVAVVLGCAGYRVVDLGVMVPLEEILAAARREKARVIGLSGLISPSLEEMAAIAREMEREGFTVPLLVGGAAASLAHTAVRIAPAYSGPVVYVKDAGLAAHTVKALLSPAAAPGFLDGLEAAYSQARQRHEALGARRQLLSMEEARKNRAFPGDITPCPPPRQPGRFLVDDYPAASLIPMIDWEEFFRVWELGPAAGTEAGERAQARAALKADAEAMLDRIAGENLLRLRAVVGIFPVKAEGEDVTLFGVDGAGKPDFSAELGRFCFLRNQEKKLSAAPNPSLADFLPERGWLGLFALSAGFGLEEARFRAAGDDYGALLLAALADRLAEAFACALHSKVRREIWAYCPDDSPGCQGIRPAFGYPACPDHSDKGLAMALLGGEDIGLRLTETAMLIPAASVCGMYFSHPGAFYFSAGEIGEDQLADWAARKDISLEEARKRTGRI
jgi:5-methyltetrahydrofolate--homocysteine methyltransferase